MKIASYDSKTDQLLHAAVNMTQAVARFKDEETDAHIARMAHYARHITMTIADEVGINDEMVNHIFRYSTLHDIGKIAIPDDILLKYGALTSDEFVTMKTHVTKGVEIIDKLIREFELDPNGEIKILHNIIAYHHERIDGSGYPYGLKGDDIPIESRIAAVADVFDALTSDRPYHRARCLEEAFAYLDAYRDIYFDSLCVSALTNHAETIMSIKDKFKDSSLG